MQELLSDRTHTECAAMLRLSATNLLLPDIMLEEVARPEVVNAVKGSPVWFLGYFNWLDRRLPLISYELLNGGNCEGFKSGSEVGIINCSINPNYLPYYGILLSQPTKFFPLKQKSIAPEFGRQAMRAEACWTNVDGEAAVIPKVEWIEEHLQAYVLNS